jgi:aurora kinase, other
LQSDFHVLVQEYAPHGDLYSYLHKHHVSLSERKIVNFILKPCLEALAYLHARNISHRDIKPENILLDAQNTIKLADFGLSVCTTEEAPVTRAGTVDYMAPEVLVCPLKRAPSDNKDRPDLAYGLKVDSWSMGVLAHELLTGVVPYKAQHGGDQLAAIRSIPLAFPAHVSDAAADWVRLALAVDPKSRPGVHELLAHPWVGAHARREGSGSLGAPQSMIPARAAKAVIDAARSRFAVVRHDAHANTAADVVRRLR